MVTYPSRWSPAPGFYSRAGGGGRNRCFCEGGGVFVQNFAIILGVRARACTPSPPSPHPHSRPLPAPLSHLKPWRKAHLAQPTPQARTQGPAVALRGGGGGVPTPQARTQGRTHARGPALLSLHVSVFVSVSVSPSLSLSLSLRLCLCLRPCPPRLRPHRSCNCRSCCCTGGRVACWRRESLNPNSRDCCTDDRLCPPRLVDHIMVSSWLHRLLHRRPR